MSKSIDRPVLLEKFKRYMWEHHGMSEGMLTGEIFTACLDFIVEQLSQESQSKETVRHEPHPDYFLHVIDGDVSEVTSWSELSEDVLALKAFAVFCRVARVGDGFRLGEKEHLIVLGTMVEGR